MGTILEINRDFPFQIPLPFDEAGMEVLEWLDEAPFEWDMYVEDAGGSGRNPRPSGKLHSLLLPRLSGRDSIQPAVRKCVGKASYRRPALIAAGHIRSCCPRVSASGAATKRYMNSALI
jgi:hypothetical protein